jgi:transaldolase
VSVASFFVSRIDTEIDTRLTVIGTDEALALRGQAAVANSLLAYAAFEELFTGPRRDALAAQGARAQRPLWASTGMKNPDYRDTHYVSELVVANMVNTMPTKTLWAFADHGEVHGDRVTGTAADAQRVFDDLQRLGIDITDVFLTLEDEGSRRSRRRGSSWLPPCRLSSVRHRDHTSTPSDTDTPAGEGRSHNARDSAASTASSRGAHPQRSGERT